MNPTTLPPGNLENNRKNPEARMLESNNDK